MKCHKCHSTNPKSSIFCRKCGTRLLNICQACGFENMSADKFCGKCGHNLPEDNEPAVRVIEAERKQVSVLFSDLSGYTAMAEKFDPEEVREIMSRIFGGTAQIVAKYQGHIDKFIGDAVMILFGVPNVHEDDPIRAIKAAIEIHDLVERMNPELEKVIGRSLKMHSGISTGLVISGEASTEQGTENVLGDTINVASRLTDIATEDEIFVDEATYRQTERYVDFEILEPVKVKGKKATLRLYEVISIRDKPSSTVHRLSGIKAELIGRKTELNELEEAARRLKEGKAGVVFISGEAGTGKSRLVEDFKATLDLKKYQWREGHSYAYSQNIPYSPLIDLLNRAWQIEESDSPDEIKEKIESNLKRLLGTKDDFAPYIGSLYGLKYPELEGIDPEFWKSRLFEGIRAILIALSQISPAIIFLEDLHWADPSSQELARRIILESGYPVLFICTYRPPFSLLNSFQLGSLSSFCREIKLKDLSASEAEDMMVSLLKTESIPDELRLFVQEKVEGNPFYLEEVVNSLIESEALVSANESWRLTRPIDEFDIPLTINGIISARVDRLEANMKRVLQEASVIGRTFLYDVLQKITQLKEQLGDCLNTLEMIDLIRRSSPQPDLEYYFKHALAQDVVYNGLLKKERQEIHERIGLVIEDIFSDRLSEFFETLAFHYKQGKSMHKAVDYLIKSGEKSLRRYAVEESHLYFKEAFDLLTNKPNRTNKDNELLVRILMQWAGVFWYRGRFRDLETLLSTHQNLAESLNSKETLGMFYGLQGMTCWSREKLVDADNYLNKSLQLGEETGNKRVLAYACTFLSYNCADWGLLDDALSYAERAQTIGLPEIPHYEALAVTGYAFWTRGDKKKLYDAGKTLLEFGKNHSNIRHMVEGYWIQGCSHLVDGSFPEAIVFFKQALNLSVDPFYSQFPKLSLAFTYLSNEQFQEAEELLREILTFSRDFGAETVGTSAQVLLGITLVNKGQISEGMEMLEGGRQHWLDKQGRWRYALSEYLLGNVYLRMVEGRSPVDKPRLTESIGFFVKDVPFAGRKAEMHFKQAVECAGKIGAKGLMGQAYLGLGKLNNLKGKKDRAKETITQSIQCFEECEIETYLKQARRSLANLE